MCRLENRNQWNHNRSWIRFWMSDLAPVQSPIKDHQCKSLSWAAMHRKIQSENFLLHCFVTWTAKIAFQYDFKCSLWWFVVYLTAKKSLSCPDVLKNPLTSVIFVLTLFKEGESIYCWKKNRNYVSSRKDRILGWHFLWTQCSGIVLPVYVLSDASFSTEFNKCFMQRGQSFCNCYPLTESVSMSLELEAQHILELQTPNLLHPKTLCLTGRPS